MRYQAEPTQALAVIPHEDDQIIELRYANQATALTPVTRPDNVGEILAAFNALNDRGLYAEAAGGAADAAAFSRDNGPFLQTDDLGIITTFLPRRTEVDTEGLIVWIVPGAGTDPILDSLSVDHDEDTIAVISGGAGGATPPNVELFFLDGRILYLRVHYNPANATIDQIVSAFNEHNDRGIYAALVEGTAGGGAYSRPVYFQTVPNNALWANEFAVANYTPDAWEEDFSGGLDVELDSAFYALGPPQSVFTGNTELAAETARNTYAAANPGWTAAYQADQRLFVLVRWGSGGNEKATILSADGTTWREIAFAFVGREGRMGNAGTPGGGAIDDTGIVLDLRSVVITANEFMSTGFMLGERGDTPIVLYQLEANALALLWFFTEDLYDLPTASDGDTADVSAAGRNALNLPESAGSSLSGTVRGGITDAGELLIAFTADDSDTHVQILALYSICCSGRWWTIRC